MPDITVVGGGLTGLAAAAELERLGARCRLIEVKPRLGGGLFTRVEADCPLDGGPLGYLRAADWSFLADLGLTDALIPAADSHERDLVAFRAGAESLVGALAAHVPGNILHRMAVSSVGQEARGFSICMENGLIFQADALILAVPARYAERMLRTLAPEAAYRLVDYGYDTLVRVSLLYAESALPYAPRFPWDMAVADYQWTDDPARVPEGHLLLQVMLRVEPGRIQPEALTAAIGRELRATAPPAAVFAHTWPEADPLPPHAPDFAAHMTTIRALLPPGVALVGSDYDGLHPAARVAAGRAAARRIAG